MIINHKWRWNPYSLSKVLKVYTCRRIRLDFCYPKCSLIHLLYVRVACLCLCLTSIHRAAGSWRRHQWGWQWTVHQWWKGCWPSPAALWGGVERPQQHTLALSWRQYLHSEKRGRPELLSVQTYFEYKKLWKYTLFTTILVAKHSGEFSCQGAQRKENSWLSYILFRFAASAGQ